MISMLGFFGFFGTIVWFIAPDIGRQSQILYLQSLEGVQRLQLWAQGPPLNVDGEDLSELINDAASWIQDQAGTIAGGIMTGVGEQSDDGKTINWKFTGNCPITKKPVTMREIETNVDANTKTLEMWGIDPKSGKEFKSMFLSLKRKS